MVNCITSGGQVIRKGIVLDILVQSRRNKGAAKKFFRKLLKGCQYVPRVLITDKLGSYAAAKQEVLPSVEHRQHKRLNNRAENSHQPSRQRERTMRRFKSGGHAQRFLAAQGPIREHVCPRRHRLSAKQYRTTMQERFVVWNTITGVAMADLMLQNTRRTRRNDTYCSLSANRFPRLRIKLTIPPGSI